MTSSTASPKTFTEKMSWKADLPYTGTHNSQEWAPSTTWTDRTEGTGNPYWKTKIKHGQNATTKRTGSKATYKSSGKFKSKFSYYGNDAMMHNDGTETFDGCPFAPGIPMPTSLTHENVTKTASLSFLQDVKSATNAVASGVILGELRQTIRMLRSPADSLMRYLDNMVHGAYKKYRHIKRSDADKVAADTWLEIQLGLIPMLMDIKGIALGIQRVAEKREFRSVSGYAQEKKNNSGPISSTYCNGSRLRAVGTINRQEEVTCRFRGSVSLETTWSGSVAENFGLLPEDFIPTLWNLLPWTFVSDYFFDIGGWLEAESAATSQIRWSCGTTRSVTLEERLLHAEASHPNVLSVSGGGKSTATLTTFARGYVTPALPKMPEFRLPGTKRSFNILALMRANQRMWPNLR